MEMHSPIAILEIRGIESRAAKARPFPVARLMPFSDGRGASNREAANHAFRIC